jgi:hypothetical protein
VISKIFNVVSCPRCPHRTFAGLDAQLLYAVLRHLMHHQRLPITTEKRTSCQVTIPLLTQSLLQVSEVVNGASSPPALWPLWMGVLTPIFGMLIGAVVVVALFAAFMPFFSVFPAVIGPTLTLRH